MSYKGVRRVRCSEAALVALTDEEAMAVAMTNDGLWVL